MTAPIQQPFNHYRPRGHSLPLDGLAYYTTGFLALICTSRRSNFPHTGYAWFPVLNAMKMSSPMLAAMRAADSITESSARCE